MIIIKKYCNKRNLKFYSESIDILKIANNKKVSRPNC